MAKTAQSSRETANMRINLPVEVRRNQGRLGGDKCPGRRGVIIDENPLGRQCEGIRWKCKDRGGLWVVRIEAKGQAGECTEAFWGDELAEIQP
ncbi:MAG: hypothetical protein EPN21_15675 [Methylococcaceae bacterium]|nr:MAG: hypothetical protein EPN21_15675 [Methylococcaceae bacterium]